ncbi:MAG: hypothetical protein ACPL68_00280, partial [Candidatus Hydrothermia bacterium]
MTGILTFCIIAQAPELAPAQNLMVGVRSDGYWVLWEPSPTESLVLRYEVFRDGELIGQAGMGEHEFLDKEAAGSHTYTVRAVGGPRYIKEIDVWGMRLPLLVWKEGGYVDAKPVRIEPLAGLVVSHRWQGFGFAGYRLEWGFRPQGFVEVIRGGNTIITLPPGTQSFTDASAVVGQKDYMIRDATTGQEIIPNIRARWEAVHFSGLTLSWDIGKGSFTLMRSSEAREQDMKTVEHTPPEPVAQVAGQESGFVDRGASKEVIALLRSRSPMSIYRYYLVSEDGSTIF